jgi:hypothetical protein
MVKNIEREDTGHGEVHAGYCVRVNTVLLTTAAVKVVKASLCLARAMISGTACHKDPPAGWAASLLTLPTFLHPTVPRVIHRPSWCSEKLKFPLGYQIS